MRTDTLVYLDCKRDSLTERLIERDDLSVIFLSELTKRGGATTVEVPQGIWYRFEFDSRCSPELEGRRFREWCRERGLAPTVWCNQNEELMEFSSRMAFAADVSTLDPATVRRVRDKVAMKEVYRDLDITHPDGRRITGKSEITAAADDYGFPLIVKPVDADSCRGAVKLSDAADVESVILDPNFTDWMAEQYVVGQEHQLCALIHRGDVTDYFVSRNPMNLIDILDGGINANITMSRSEQSSFDLSSMLHRLVGALGLYNCYFHAEFFVTPDGRIVMGEMAARMSGCEVVRNHGLARRAPIIDTIIDIYLDRQICWRASGDISVGDLLLPAQAGRVETVTPTEYLLELPGVERVAYFHAKGDSIVRQRNSGWCFGNVQVSGVDSHQVEQRMHDVLAAFHLSVS